MYELLGLNVTGQLKLKPQLITGISQARGETHGTQLNATEKVRLKFTLQTFSIVRAPASPISDGVSTLRDLI